MDARRRGGAPRDRGSALITFVFVLVLVLAIVGLALESSLSARREENAAQARLLAREAAEAGASRAYVVLSRQYVAGSGFTTSITTGGGTLGWPLRQPFGQGASWKVRVLDNDDGDGDTSKDSDSTCLLYVTGRAAAPSGGDAVYDLVKTIRAAAATYPAYMTGTGSAAVLGNVATDDFEVQGQYGNVRVAGTLSLLAGKLGASQSVGYGTFLLELPLTTISPAAQKIAPPPTPATTAADAWNAALAAGGTTYVLTAAGTVTDGQGNFIALGPWSGWVYALGQWTHALNGHFTPGGIAATIYTPANLVITGGPAAARVSFIARGSVTLAPALTPVAITPQNGIAIFADQDVLVASTPTSAVTLGTAAAPGFVVAGEQISLAGTGAGISVNGAVVAKSAAAVSPLVLANQVTGKVTIRQDTPPNFILGQPVLKTLVACEAVRDPAGVFPVDASEGPLGVYR